MKEDLLKELKKINKNFFFEENSQSIMGLNLGLKEFPEILTDIPFGINLGMNKIKKIPKDFKQNGILSLTMNFIEELYPFDQTDQVFLEYNELTYIHPFKQEFHMDLSHNKIKNISNIFQKNTLDVSGNQISSLKDFRQGGDLRIANNPLMDLNGFEYDSRYEFSINNNIHVSKGDKPLQLFLDKNNVKYNIVQEKYKGLL